MAPCASTALLAAKADTLASGVGDRRNVLRSGDEQCWVIGPDHIAQFRISRYIFWVASLKMLQSDPTLEMSM